MIVFYLGSHSDILAELSPAWDIYCKSQMVSMQLHPKCASHLLSIKISLETFASSQITFLLFLAQKTRWLESLYCPRSMGGAAYAPKLKYRVHRRHQMLSLISPSCSDGNRCRSPWILDVARFWWVYVAFTRSCPPQNSCVWQDFWHKHVHFYICLIV